MPSGAAGGAGAGDGVAVGVWARSVSGEPTIAIVAVAHKSSARAMCRDARFSSDNDEDCWTRFVWGSIDNSLLEKHIAEIGAMNLRVTHGAGLILGRLVVRGTAWPARGQGGRESVALQTEHVHRHHVEQLRIGGSMGRMATGAALGFHRHMLVNERTLLIDVALVADRSEERR